MDESPLIKFRCESCGQKIIAPRIYAGKKSKCPACKKTLVIPLTGDSDHSDIGLKSLINPAMFDIPPGRVKEQKPPAPPPEQPSPHKAEVAPEPILDTTAFDILPKQPEPEKTAVDYFKKLEEPPPERKFPFLLDIFLYPLNVPGLAILGIVIGIPLVFAILLKFLFLFTLVFPPAGVLLAFVGAISFIINIILPFYFYWYLAECVRDSAGGAIRTPETMAITPGLWELLWQTVKILVCLVFFSAPAFIYISMAIWKSNLEWTLTLASMRNDPALWLWASYGIFFFPMGLLAVVMFDSISGLNPILFIGSIYSTFLPYCGLILSFYAFGYLIIKINQLLAAIPFLPQVWFYVSQVVIYCLLMVMAHILGRFYWRYEEKLSWDV